MRKIILSLYVSLDGFFAGPNGEVDWFVWDKEMENFSIDFIESVDTMLFGRVTYQLMESYWPNASPPTENQIIIDAMNNTPKIVFSKTLEKAEWNNTKLIKDNIAEHVSNLKPESGKNIVIYGSNNLAVSLTQYKLIDEYHIFVNPVVLGKGKYLLEGLSDKLNLKLLKTKKFSCGNVLVCYQPCNPR